MSDTRLTIDFGGLSKPATALVEKIADAGTGLFRPWQIKRVAKAEAEAASIKVGGEIVSDLQRRAFQRFLQEEEKKQENMESIAGTAIRELREDAVPQRIANDWMANFFDKCRLISDQEMQALWSKVLAGEANSPGSFSKRTVNMLSSLDQRDAEAFQLLCSFSWKIGEYVPLIFNLNSDIYDQAGLKFSAIKHLNEIGLISYQPLSEFGKPLVKGWNETSYFGDTVLIEPEIEGRALSIGHTLFSKTGQELLSICDAKPVPDFKELVIKRWRGSKVRVIDQSVPPQPYEGPKLSDPFDA
jgi:hypothetical protein